MMKIGLMCIGLNTYWRQYEGLLPRLLSYGREIAGRMQEMDTEVVFAGMVDSPEKAQEAVAMFRAGDVELLCIHISTYALSATVLPLVQAMKCPVLLLNIQPAPAIDYAGLNAMDDKATMTAEWLAHCSACSLPELACVFNRSGLRYGIVTGHLADDEMWQELHEWMDAARAAKGMRENRMGILGHYYGGMLDVYSDTTRLTATFGTYFEMLEMCELKALRDSITPREIEAKLHEFDATFKVDARCAPAELRRAALTSIAIDKLVDTHRLGSVAYYYEGYDGNAYEDIVTSMIAAGTLLTGRGIPMAGECEVKNAHAMKIMSLLGAGGSFSEPYAMDFHDNVVLWGHDGPGHFNMAEDGISLVPLPVFHGKPGQGLSIQMSVRQGDVTLLSVCEGADGIHLLVAEGESVAGPTMSIGNTNSRYRFPIGIKEFMRRWSMAGPSHHCAIGIGHVASRIKKLAFLLGIPVTDINDR